MLGWDSWGHWLLMEHTNMLYSITQLHLELVNLLLKKSSHHVALHYFSTMLQNLKPLNLSVSQAKTSLKSLGQVHHLIHVPLLKGLIAVLGIHIPNHRLDSLISHISR